MWWVPSRSRNVLDSPASGAPARVAAVAAAAAAALASPAFPVASPWSDHEVVAVRLVAGAPREGATLIGLHFRLAPEWHVYWKHPGDAGAAPEVALSLDGRPIESGVEFPAPQRFRLPGELEALGYQGEVVYPVHAALPAGGELHATVDYVACAIECIPFHDELELSLGATAGTAADEELLRAWEARLPLPAGAFGLEPRLRYVVEPEPELEIALAGRALAGAEPELFLEPSAGATFGPATRHLSPGAAVFRIPVKPEVADRAPPTLRVSWTVTGLRAHGEIVAAADVAEVPAGSAPLPGGQAGGVAAMPRRQPSAPGAREPVLIAALSLPPLLLAVFAWAAPRRENRVRAGTPALLSPLLALPDPLLRGIGFVAAAALVWSSYRLAPLLPAASLAGLQLSWLGVALAAHSAMRSAGARRLAWSLLAAAAAALGVWLA